jgi:diguanylate cyclase (GGDEF)-like protein
MMSGHVLARLHRGWWRGIDAIEAHLVERRHAANIRVFCLGFAAVLSVIWGLQWLAGWRVDLDALYRPGWWATSLAWQAGLIAWLLGMATWGKRARDERAAHPWAVQLALLPALGGIVVLGVAHGLHDTPVPMLILNVLVFARGLFAWREVRWALALSVLLVLTAELLLATGLMPYAPLLSTPVFTGGALHPWWAMWVRVLFVLAAVLMSLVLFCLAVAVQRRRAELETLVRTDALTGLANRREFMTQLEREAHRQARSGRPMSVVLFDVDHFKQVNDRWGHPAGDQVLARIGALLKAHTRDQVDTAARYGGEEFVLLLPDTGVNEACLVAEKIAVRLRQERFSVGDQGFQVTQSVGVAQVVEGDLEQALRVADRNMYRAKQAGRDRMVASVAFPEDVNRPALAV